MNHTKKNFTMAQNALWRLYTQLPDFNADHALMYIVLCDYYNDDYGYAYPTQWDLAHRLNCGENKPREVLRILVKYELIRIEPSKFGDNDVYYLYEPIGAENQFYAKFPEAKAYFTERDARFEKRRKKNRSVTVREAENKPVDVKLTNEEQSVISWL